MIKSRAFKLAIAVLATMGFSVLGAGSAAAVSPINSVFSFCNNTGSNNTAIACFSANLHFNSANVFTLSNIKLTDRKCDARSALALVHDQSDIYPVGIYGGRYYTYKNSNGCGTTEEISTNTFERTGGVNFVQIALFACNSTSCSSTVESLRHGNPYTGH